MGGYLGFLAMRTSVALTERAHEALKLFQSITSRTFSDIVNELLLAEIEGQRLTSELDE
jgi:hypothetical protein